MVWFSDIEKHKEPKEEPQKKQEETVLKRAAVDDAQALYNQAIVSLKEMQQKYIEKKELDIQKACSLVEGLVNNVLLGDDKIVALTTNTYRQDWSCYHSVNIVILAAKIGRHLEYSFDQLIYLGVFALLHEIGYSAESLDFQGLEKQELIRQFIQIKQIKESFIKEALSIIAVLDVYEAFTHERHYREKFAPYEVLRSIISAGETVFNIKVVKEIIEIFSIYPLGSFVRLNTEEIAQVIRINKDFPLRPEVAMLTDGRGKKLKEKNAIDLRQHFNIFIKEALSNEDPFFQKSS
ncbi:MAG: hypothetical protein Q8K15_03905 [Candidatus Omnitrophota bacterium]|nr:hypothetical protein [Candidatus Omnitrophota bacterium]